MSMPSRLVILTGAGVSAESGLATFRGADGLWEGRRVEDICTPEALARDPRLVLDFYDQRRRALATVDPNAAHRALVRLEAEWEGELVIVTQNVDDLHERAGSRRLIHMHGELKSALCASCGERTPWKGDLLAGRTPISTARDTAGELFPTCHSCARPALRPDIVFFGEMPYAMEEIERALSRCDLFVSIGTSGAVYPAAGFVQIARHHGADTLELNLEPSAGSAWFAETRVGPAGKLVPAWVDEMLAR